MGYLVLVNKANQNSI